MKKPSTVSTLIEQRPHYYRGQLLLEDDFLAEQNYHVNARLRHNLHLHGWGVVHGLTISRETGNAVKIAPGFAVDALGREILVTEYQHLSVADFGPNELLTIGLTYQEAAGSPENGAARPQNLQDFYALVTAFRASEKGETLSLGRIQLDPQGEIGEDAIDYEETTYLRILAPGSITRKELHPELRTGWVRMPFRAHPLVNLPEGEAEMPPMFRVGATEALSPSPKEAGEKDRGAAGTMAIPIPPNATRVTRLRIAGSQNDGEILLELFKGGWDTVKKQHVREKLLEEKIASGEKWFEETFPIENTSLDPEYNTLVLWLRGTRRTAVSMVAVEFAY
ncbi:MAG: hypothetical protein V2I48_02330 [Xanthomonadales bacterium]|jgi:hypothetical protein|nr:hypothetical protein [Xanthomonadales bacterium]